MRAIALPVLLMSLIGGSPVAPPPPISGFMNAERLSAHCAPEADAEAGMADICVGYIAGATDALMARQSELPVAKRTICLPTTATIGDIRSAVQIHLEMFDYEPNTAAAVIVERTLTATYPC